MTGAVHHTVPPGKTSTVSVEDDVEKVREYFLDHAKAHIRCAVTELNMSYGKIWNILKKTLGSKYGLPNSPMNSPQGIGSHVCLLPPFG